MIKIENSKVILAGNTLLSKLYLCKL